MDNQEIPTPLHPDVEEVLQGMDEEPADEFNMEDWELPSAFTDELMADTALTHLKTIATCEVNIIGNKSVHNDTEVQRLVQIIGAAKRSLQEIKRTNPGAMAIVRELAAHQVKAARQVRESAKQ